MSIIRYFNPNTLEDFKTKQGWAKSAPIIRSEGFLLQYRNWKKSYTANSILDKMRFWYEDSFFNDQEQLITIEETEGISVVKFSNLTSFHTSQAFFLLDYLKECAELSLGLTPFKTESYRKLQPDETILIRQRYWLDHKLPFWKRFLPKRISKRNWLLIETSLTEDKNMHLIIKSCNTCEGNLIPSIHQIMASFFTKR